MQQDEHTLALYRAQAPDMLEAVADENNLTVMRRDTITQACVKLENGLCGIHARYGERFLSDACHFYPRITRSLGGQAVMTASLSCPEIARLALEEEGDIAAMRPAELERLPAQMREYLPPGIDPAAALELHRFFLHSIGDAAMPPEQALARLASVARSLDFIAPADWPGAARVFWSLAEGRMLLPLPKVEDPFHLLQSLCGLIVATRKPVSPALQEIIAAMEQGLCVTIDAHTAAITLTPESAPAAQRLHATWLAQRGPFAAPLRRWLQMQISIALFPFAGFGDTLTERITVIGVRYATLRLALMCTGAEKALASARITQTAQALARVLDHLGDPAFSLSIYKEAGWDREERLRGLLDAEKAFG